MYVMERVTITRFLVMEAVKVWISSCASLEINVTVIGIIAIMKNIVTMDLMRVGPAKPGMCKPVKCVLQMCGNYMCTDCVIFQMLCLLQIYLLPTFKSYVGLYFELYIFFFLSKKLLFCAFYFVVFTKRILEYHSIFENFYVHSVPLILI